MIMKVIINASIVAIIAHGVLLPVHAEEDYTVFENVDSNADGFISKNEANVRKDLSENWKAIDKDNDDKLDISEFSAFEGEGQLTPPQDPDMGELGAAPYPDPSE